MRSRAIARLETESALRRALEHGEISVHYQPVIKLATGRVAGVEALVRWNHPERGLIPPGDFIMVAEETGLIVSLGGFVLTEACMQVARWNSRHPDSRPLTVSVNLSAHQLRTRGLRELVVEALQQSRLQPRLLCLEITETALVEDADASRAALDGLKDLGVTLAVDDFGTGYSSLIYLRRFPVGVLKIDRSFVVGLGTNAEDTAIVAGVVGLARALGMLAVAEGVETPEQAARLAELGCPLGQGYHWSKPLSARQMERWLKQHWADSQPAPPPTRVLVVDDDPRLREVVSLALQFDGSFEVVAEASDGTQAIECAGAHQPDLVLLDLAMPGMDGRQALPHILDAAPSSKVVVLSALEWDDVDDGLLLGTAGFLQKDVDLPSVVERLTDLLQATA
jgi:EAL domain-containing protein (putative c-di-GMP-specific phosphodiesterase class I)